MTTRHPATVGRGQHEHPVVDGDVAPSVRPQLGEGQAPSGRSQGRHKKDYRWDIQGMRAVAVVLVMLAHADVPGFEGGFIGVDVFFVISGFLITGLLLEDGRRHGRIGFLGFYTRRARRILPAATVVIVATSIASTFLLNAYQAKSELVDGVWAGLFAVNVRFARAHTDYFTKTAAIVSPLQHYWSLSVEEQFYVVWPALLAVTGFGMLALARRARVDRRAPSTGRIGWALATLGCLSLALSIHQTATNRTGAYFSTLDRAWELIVGALLAVLLPHVARLPGQVRAVLTWLGLAAIVVAALTFSAATPVPGSATLLPVLGAAAVLAGGVGAPRGSAAHLLGRKPFRFVGAISYSLYLWHWPLLILAAAYFPFPLNLAQRLCLLVVALVISVASYAFIELPFQRARRLTRRSYSGMVLWPVAVTLVVVVAIVGESEFSYVGANGPAVPGLSPAAAVQRAVTDALARSPIPNPTSPGVLQATSNFTFIGSCSGWQHTSSRVCEMGDPTGAKTIVVFGNSHSSMWIPTVAVLAKQARWKFFPIVKEACGYDDYDALRNVGIHNQCVRWYHWAVGIIRRLHPNVVVVGAYGYREWAKGLAAILPRLKPLIGRLVLIADVPGVPDAPGYCLSQHDANQGTCLWKEPKQRVKDLAIARDLAKANRIGFVDPESWFCYRHLCPSVINGVIPYYDTSHLTVDYARYLAPALGRELDLTGRPRR